MAFLSNLNLVHRDLKPQNILIKSYEFIVLFHFKVFIIRKTIKIMDFGVEPITNYDE